jgi:hypothetical protein
MAMTEHQREQFQALAESVWAEVPELTATLLAEVKRAGQARDEVDLELVAGSEQTTTSEGKQLFAEVQDAQHAVLNADLDLIEGALKRLVEAAGEAEEGAPTNVAVPSDVTAAFAKLTAMGFGVQIAKLFTGFALTSLHGSLASYIAACEAFLGRDIGSHEAGHRAWRAIQAAFGEALESGPGLIFPPLGLPLAVVGVVKAAFQEAKDTPQRKGARAQKAFAAGYDKVVTLRRLALSLSEQMPFTEGTVEVSVDAVVEVRAALPGELQAVAEAERRLRPRFEGSPPAKPTVTP